jgi:hypothetical protein
MSGVYMRVTKDFTKQFQASIDGLKKDVVLVGIPSSSTDRGGEINNATLLAINNFGSPMNNIPPRPIMEIGISNAKDDIAKQFENAAKAILKDGPGAQDKYFERVGIIASNSIKQVINDGSQIKKPSDTTLKIRRENGFKGIKALLVTGQLKNAITYVLRKKGS